MYEGYLRVTAAIPAVQPADVSHNVASIIKMIEELSCRNADMIVFPEMSVTGYTCADLFHSATLISSVKDAILRICHATARPDSPLVFVGAPLLVNDTLYNC
ncbi:MAG: NAD(+) synthase, partial [Muribaculaceae bacterium]|nr:NAD(+) synthase [Muribaculaceae bacterium]